MVKKTLISILIFLVVIIGAISGGIWYYLNQIPKEDVAQIEVTKEDAALLEKHSIPTSTNTLGMDENYLSELEKNFGGNAELLPEDEVILGENEIAVNEDGTPVGETGSPVLGADGEVIESSAANTKPGATKDDKDSKPAPVAPSFKNITNILLLGIDSDDGIGRSDAIMILTVDKNHSKIKLTSLIRDSYVYIAGHGMDKLNHAYAFGGSSLAIRTVNTNFSMNITDFVSVNFNSIKEIVNALGGINITLSSEEARIIGVKGSGSQHLTGSQVLAYSRIRSTAGGDFTRTSRQRIVLSALINKIKNSGVSKIPGLVNALRPMVRTSLSNSKIISLGSAVALDDYAIKTASFPQDSNSVGVLINSIYYLKWPKNTTINNMHSFIFY